MAFVLSSTFHPTKVYEPPPRYSHSAAAVRGRCYLRGGFLQDSSESGRKKLASTIEIFDPYLETWEKHHTTGVPPPGLYDGACTSLRDSLYWFGGWDGRFYCNSIHRLDTITLEWKELQALNQAEGPMRKNWCGMVSFQDQLATFGGYGIPSGPIQPGATFIQDPLVLHMSEIGWSNELHVFDITRSKWSSPPTTGPRPPPCYFFSFTAINDHQAVLFGGNQPGHHRDHRVNDCFLMDFESMKWTKLEKPEGAPWPAGRDSHAACCLNYGEEYLQLLVTGGVDNNGNSLSDAWILDVNMGRWRELTFHEAAKPRLRHTATALSLVPGRTQVIMFGGCPKWEWEKYDQQKLAITAVLEFGSNINQPSETNTIAPTGVAPSSPESLQLPPSGEGPPTREWVLVGVADSSQLGSTERLAELERIRKHAHMRERQELKKKVHQLEDELASVQRQSRLALARAVSAEIEADKVPVLEQQLAQTKTNLEEQIHLKHQARIAAEQQLQQVLEHELHMKDEAERQFNEATAGLQHALLVKDQAIATYQQQIHHIMKEYFEHQSLVQNKQAMTSAQQQFNRHVKALEHQIEVREQARVALEMQIEAKYREKSDLEQQLYQKEEQIQTKEMEKVELEQQLCWKEEQIQTQDRERAELEQQLRQKEQQIQTNDREKAELEQQLRQKEEQIQTKDREKAELEQQVKEDGPPEMTQVAEMQQEGSGHITAQGETPSFHQLLQLTEELRTEVKTKEEELRQVKEEHEAELSRLTHESTAKQQEIEFELKAQLQAEIRTRNEEIRFLQSQADALQCDKDNLQQQLRERDTQISSESQHEQNRIETLTTDREELTSQMHVLEAKFKEVELFRDHYSQEVDQLREEPMDKIMKIESLGKQQKDVVPADTLPTTPTADIDKVEVKHQNVQTKSPEMKDQNTWTEIVKDEVQDENTPQQQAGLALVEMKNQQIQTETVQPMEQTGSSDEVEIKDQLIRIETVDQRVQAGETVQQQEYLRGFETFAETSFNISDSHSHSFEWQRYGLKLHIPEGAVTAEHTEYTVDIKVGLIGQFNIPDDLQLVSCIYWLRGPQRPFLKPVTLEIEHCASLQDSSKSESLRFVVAKCSQPELPYQFRVLEKGTFVPQSCYGSIQVSQFSFFGITLSRRSSRSPQYYSALFYIQKGLNWWHVDFVITLHLKGSRKAIKDNYSRLDAISGPGFPVHFENDTISLAIPEDGVCLENGWTITPLIPPVIDKQQVYRFKPREEVPYCRLQVKLDKDKKPVALEHKVKLQGAKSPRNFFTITCPPEGSIERAKDVTDEQGKQFGQSEQGVLKKTPFSDVADRPILSPVAADNAPNSGNTASSPRDLGSKYAGLESEPELSDLMNEVASKVSAKWKQISIQLGLTPNDEECFMASTPNDPIQCITSVFKVWKKRATKPYTWSTMIEVLNAAAVDEIRLAKELTTKLSAVHCSSPKTVSY